MYYDKIIYEILFNRDLLLRHVIIVVLALYLGSFNLLLLGINVSSDTLVVREALAEINRRVHLVIHAFLYCLLWRERSLIANLRLSEFNTLFLELKCFTGLFV